MYQAKVIPTEHKDIIHDVSFDFYGRRMATCSSDHTVKVRLFVGFSFCMDLISQTITSKLVAWLNFWVLLVLCNLSTPQPTFTCSKLAIKTIEQGMKYVQS